MNLGNSWSFVDNIWSKIKNNSQNHIEEAQDWASHLKHLQFFLLKFDTDGASEKFDLIRFFWKDLKPSIKAQIEQKDRELNNWEEIVEKVVDIEAKMGL